MPPVSPRNITKELYETEEACLKAEQAHTAAACKKEEEERRKSEERKARAQEVEQARIAANEAATNYRKLLADFCKDYGSYHYTIKNPLDHKSYIESEINKAVNVGLFDLAHSLGIL